MKHEQENTFELLFKMYIGINEDVIIYMKRNNNNNNNRKQKYVLTITM